MIRYKKILSIAMSMVVMATLFSTNVFACNCCTSPFEINGDTLILQKGGKAKLRDKIQNDINNIRRAIVEPGITSLVGTFEGFTCLKQVTFDNNSELEEIGDNAFKNCTNLERITIPGSVRTIGKEAFSGCENLETVTIEQIDERRNRFARNFAPDVFPPAPEEQTIKIDDNAFLNCKKLKRVIIISDNVSSIGKNAFMDCKSLKSITNSQNNNNRDIITIPNSVTEIGSNAFSGCNSLTSVTIPPSSIIKISEGIFQGCKRLRSVTISDRVTDIGEWAFKDCEELKTINIPNSVENIDTDAFKNCKNLKNIKIGNKIIEKFKDIFGGLNIENVTISDDIQEINDETFTGYTSLKHVTIPSSVKTIGNRAFMGCSNLESVTLDNNNVQNDANNNDCKIGQMAFMGCINLQRICIPETVKNIDRYAFLGCTSLISRDDDELRIPNSVTDIGEYAFMGCLSLNKLTIPDRTTNIHNYALMGCINLNTLSMPRNVILGHHAIIGDFIENIIYRDIV